MTVCFISADHDTVQQDLLLLEQWAAMWQKNFTPSKCNTVSISLKHQPSRYMYLNTLCNTPYFWWVSLFRNGRLILHCQLPQLVKADCRSTWKEATKILGVHRRNLATCGPVVKEQAYLAMSIHCVNMAPLPGLHTHRTISAVPWYQTLSEGCPIWQYFSWSRQATASLCVIWVSMQHPFRF